MLRLRNGTKPQRGQCEGIVCPCSQCWYYAVGGGAIVPLD